MARARTRLGGAWLAIFALLVSGTVAAACGDSSTPAGTGNDVLNDTRDASTRAPPNPDPGDGAIPMGEPEGSASYGEGGAYADAPPAVTYPGTSECSTCTCGAAYSYCFGGATPKSEPQAHPAKSDAGTDAGNACPMVAAGALGCTALPASCINANPADDCACLAALLQSTYACVLNCAYDGKTSTVFCPSP